MSDEQKGKGKDLEITIYNEDDGRSYTFHAGSGTPVRAIIERMYEKLNISRQADDRLRCECNGADIFSFADMHLGDYVSSGRCPDLVWLFAGGTGGA